MEYTYYLHLVKLALLCITEAKALPFLRLTVIVSFTMKNRQRFYLPIMDLGN